MKIMKEINKTKSRFVRFLRSLMVKKPRQEFPATADGFYNARKWALSQPHPYVPELSLWDYACIEGGSESLLKLHVINKFVKGILDDEIHSV